MESELSGIFRVKLVTKNIVRGSPETQFMHMRVNEHEVSCKEDIANEFNTFFTNIGPEFAKKIPYP